MANAIAMKHLILCLFILAAYTAPAQNTASPCTSPECRQFDFWVGDWDLVYSDTMHAQNHITKDMNGCVTHEHFDDPANKYKGESWSVYNPQTKLWQQTWVDNLGAYIALTGKFENNAMTLLTQPKPYKDGKTIQNRMVYKNITSVSFDWVWEATTDEGKSWQPNWVIHYTRK
jgi:hypothetical protein